jgi:hypothetical protein
MTQLSSKLVINSKILNMLTIEKKYTYLKRNKSYT